MRTVVASEAEGGAMHEADAKAGGNTLKLGWQILGHFGYIQPKRAIDYVPTPTVFHVSMHDEPIETFLEREKRSSTGQLGKSLGVAIRMDWGKFKPAIERWEKVLGRPAPEPTQPDGKDGSQRLSPRFTEWLMGLPDGWITAPELNLTRAESLKMAGNGVCPQQAELALTNLLKGVKF